MAGAAAVAAGIAPDADWYEAERAITFGGWQTVSQLGRHAHTLQIAGATHLSFMDLPFLPSVRAAPSFRCSPPRPSTRLAWHTITGEIVDAFFDQYLDLHPNQLLDRPDLIGPEVTLGAPSLAVTTMSDGGR